MVGDGLRSALPAQSFGTERACEVGLLRTRRRGGFRTQVDLVVEVRTDGNVSRVTVGREVVLTLEGLDLLHGDLELMGDPGVGATLANPSANLVEVRAQRASCHLTVAQPIGSAPEATLFVLPPPDFHGQRSGVLASRDRTWLSDRRAAAGREVP